MLKRNEASSEDTEKLKTNHNGAHELAISQLAIQLASASPTIPSELPEDTIPRLSDQEFKKKKILAAIHLDLKLRFENGETGFVHWSELVSLVVKRNIYPADKNAYFDIAAIEALANLEGLQLVSSSLRGRGKTMFKYEKISQVTPSSDLTVTKSLEIVLLQKDDPPPLPTQIIEKIDRPELNDEEKVKLIINIISTSYFKQASLFKKLKLFFADKTVDQINTILSDHELPIVSQQLLANVGMGRWGERYLITPQEFTIIFEMRSNKLRLNKNFTAIYTMMQNPMMLELLANLMFTKGDTSS